jgi:hypothetical protein
MVSLVLVSAGHDIFNRESVQVEHTVLVDAGLEGEGALLVRLEVLNAVHGFTYPHEVLLLIDGRDVDVVLLAQGGFGLELLFGLELAVDRTFF